MGVFQLFTGGWFEMMTDKELLELAAKARGFKISGWNSRGGIDVAALEDGTFWQPLLENNITDCDGDALRLAIALDMSIEISDYENSSYAYAGEFPRKWAMDTWHISRNDKKSATRRAIVRAAAAVGKAVQ